MASSKTLTDYQRIAQEHNLYYLSPTLPLNVRHAALWRCLVTGQIFSRAYQSIRNKGYGSAGAKFYEDNRLKFIESGNRHGLKFVEDLNLYMPETTKHPALWRTAEGRYVVISYNQISYPNRLLDYQRHLIGLQSKSDSDPVDPCSMSDIYEEAVRKNVKVLFVPPNDTLDARGDHSIFECNETGHIFSRTYRSLQTHDIASLGLRYFDRSYELYLTLAQKHHIQWIPDAIPFKPQSEKHPTAWRLSSGSRIYLASFNQMMGPRADKILRQVREQEPMGA